MATLDTAYEEIGRCIYCPEQTELTDEHVAPYGIGGQVVLKKASCKACAQMTGEVERRVLRQLWWVPRSSLQAPTRRSKERPRSFTLQLTLPTGDVFSEQLPIELGRMIYFPVFQPPTYLQGRMEAGPLDFSKGKFLMDPESQDRIEKFVVEKYGVGVEIRPRVDIPAESFTRFLGKIGYCLAVALVGVDAVYGSDVRHIVRGSLDTASVWIGCTGDRKMNEDASDLECYAEGRSDAVLSQMRFFSRLNGPTYAVVVTRYPA